MLRELVASESALSESGVLLPVAHRKKRVKWIIDISEMQSGVFNAMEQREFGLVVPDRQRSSMSANLKPFLLVDDARFVFGAGTSNRADENKIAHQKWLELLDLAIVETGIGYLKDIRLIATGEQPLANIKDLKEREWITFRINGEYPTDHPAIRSFWIRYFQSESIREDTDASVREGSCSVCGQQSNLVRTLPNEVVIAGEKCQISSFNKAAFESFQKEQMSNAPLCVRCAFLAPNVLNSLIKSELPRHSAVLVRHTEGKGRQKRTKKSIHNQLAVFWLKEGAGTETDTRSVDLLTALSSLTIEPKGQSGVPEAELAQIEAFLRIPFSGREQALRLDENAFYLAVLSANKARLVVREWFALSIALAQTNIAIFVDAVRLIDAAGARMQVHTIPALLRALKTDNPNLVRGLIRSAYRGGQPPMELIGVALPLLRNPAIWVSTGKREEKGKDDRDVQDVASILAVLKLTLTHGSERAKAMTELDSGERNAAYLCGRMLAICEEAQRRAAHGKLNATLVERFYGGASVSPLAVLPGLIRQLETAHLPKVRKQQRGYDKLRSLIEEIAVPITASGGWPANLLPVEQGWFALGFYHQRAKFTAEREEILKRFRENQNREEAKGES